MPKQKQKPYRNFALRAAMIRAARVACGLTQQETWEAAGIAEPTLYFAERGAQCSDKTLNKLRAVFRQYGVTVYTDGDESSATLILEARP